MKLSKLIFWMLTLFLLVGTVFYVRDTEGPQLQLTPKSPMVTSSSSFELSLSDVSGLRYFSLTTLQAGERFVLLQQDFLPGTKEERIVFDLSGAGLSDGEVLLEVMASDRDIYQWGGMNQSVLQVNYQIDNTPPQIVPAPGIPYIAQGGSGIVFYTLDEETVSDGILAGESFFPGYPLGEGRVALLSVPWREWDDDFVFQYVARDPAGNQRLKRLPCRVSPRDFPEVQIRLPSASLAAKMDEFVGSAAVGDSAVERFLWVNNDLRQDNRQRLRELARHSAAEPLWQGGFLRQPRTARRGTFGERRTYSVDGVEIDRKDHLGIDLASVAQDAVIAANHGRVVFAGELGVYGNCVVVDHGLGLQTLYAHLSRATAEVGAVLKKGEVLGHTGVSGLAWCDHLHFGVLIAGQPVNPQEWWDAEWVESRINAPLRKARGASTGTNERVRE